MCKISIIIPVYNSEKYLRECLDSVLAQIYTDFEVLLIDDGSTDASGAICEEYATRDARFKVFHKENGGVSSARNLGIEKAKGEWITFVDSDDVLTPSYTYSFFPLERNVDFILQGVVLLFDQKKNKLLFQFKQEEYLSLIQFLNKYTLYEFFAGPWAKLFSVRILKSNNNLRFKEFMSWGEDVMFNLEYIKHCKSIKTVVKSEYCYRQIETGLSSKRLYFENLFEFYKIVKHKLDNLKSTYGEFNINQHMVLPMQVLLDYTYKKGYKSDTVISYKNCQLLIVEFHKELDYYYKDSRFRGVILRKILKFRNCYLFDKVNRYLVYKN